MGVLKMAYEEDIIYVESEWQMGEPGPQGEKGDKGDTGDPGIAFIDTTTGDYTGHMEMSNGFFIVWGRESFTAGANGVTEQAVVSHTYLHISH